MIQLPRKRSLAALLPLALAASAVAAAAQLTPRTIGAPRPAATDTARGLDVDGGANAGAGPLLDVAVSRTGYRLGPGDVVDVAVFGDLEFLYSLAVTPEGTVVVPSVGVARVLGLNLDQAQARVRDMVYRYYRNVEVTLTLSKVRVFKVYVLGAVPNPGVRTAAAVTRLSDVVPSGAPRRNILVRHARGDSTRVDLAQFYLFGNLDANPTLTEGDVVVVPRVDRTLQVFGRVAFPGVYEFRPGETLADFLRLVNGGGPLPANAGDTIQVSRFGGRTQGQTVVAMSVADALGARGQAFALAPFDALYVPEIADYKVQRFATVSGEVNRPGIYPIRTDTTTLRELVAMAGGFTREASLLGATLRRAPIREGRVRNTDDTAPVRTLSAEEGQIKAIEAEGDAQNVVVDFQQIFVAGNDAYEQRLRGGDALYIPERREEVVVLGAVIRPGLVQYSPELGVQGFVNRAGGFTSRADWRESVVLRASTGARIPVRDVQRVEPGDRIIVPFRARRTVLERVATVQAVTAIFAGVATSVAVILALFTD
ncbi:MAG TPA: SLBB domain-containing protein [Longimicrobium sp.]|nr:SLBB domain-containing protein [Longimicrobium sp.]